jgi:hypothetical protein
MIAAHLADIAKPDFKRKIRLPVKC